MKLLCVVPSYWPAFQFGGPVFSVHNLNKSLSRLGVDVSVYTTSVGLDGDIPLNQPVELDGVAVTYFDFNKFLEFVGTTGWQFSTPMTKALRRTVKDFDIVYIVGVWNYPDAVAGYYCSSYNKPYVVSPRGHLYPEVTSKKRWKKLPYFNLIAKRVLSGASAVHYTTQDEANNCHSHFGLKNQSFVVPNGVDIEGLSNGAKPEDIREKYPYIRGKKVLLSLGRISWKKGFDILIRAYGMLLDERDDLHLLIVGGDEDGYIDTVKKMLGEHSIRFKDFSGDGEIPYDSNEPGECSVTITGMLTGARKLGAFSLSDVFVLPSYSENFGMSAVEAMACGVPTVLSTEVGIASEAAKESACVVVAPEAGELYRGIKSVLDDRRLAERLSARGRSLVESSYESGRVAELMIREFEGVLEQG